MKSWKSNHPNFKFELWTAHSNRFFVSQEFPNFLKYYDTLAYKSGALRYLYLYKYGGVFTDLFVEALGKVENSLGYKNLVLFRESKNGVFQISDSIMASAPGHPFWLACIDQMILNHMEERKECGTECVSGPKMLNQVFERFMKENANDKDLMNSILVVNEGIHPLSEEKLEKCSSTSKEFDMHACKSNQGMPESGFVSYSPNVMISDDIDFDGCGSSSCYLEQFSIMLATLKNALPLSTAFQSSCPSKLKVYTYPLNEGVNVPDTDWGPHYLCPRSKYCDGTQFALTALAHQFFLTSCIRTLDPEEADLFYVPYYALNSPSMYAD